jgi:hypothetical protein
VLAHRAIKATPNAAPGYSRLATSLFDLGQIHVTAEEYLILHRQMIRALQRFFELCVSEAAIRDALSEASTLVGAASQLASKCGVPAYLDEALRTGERVVALNPAAEGKSAIGVWILCNNLQNVYRWLAKDHPAATTYYDLRRLELASCEIRALRAAGSLATISMQERTLRGLAALHARLAASQPDQQNTHVHQARQAISACATLSDDHEFRKQIAAFNESLEWQLAAKGLSTEQVVPKVADYDAVMVEFRERARSAATAIASFAPGHERQQVLGRVLDEWYSALSSDLTAAVVESGIDYDLCKALLVLGACTDGRLGPVSYDIAREWRWRFEQPDPSDEPSAAAIRARQYLPVNREADATRQKLWGRLAGLSDLREQLRPTVGPSLRVAFSSRTATLLRNLLTIWPCVQHEKKYVDVSEDVAALLENVAPGVVRDFTDGYQDYQEQERAPQQSLDDSP